MDYCRPEHPDEQVNRLISEYFSRRQSGEDSTPDRFAADHAEMAEALLPYLKGLSLLSEIIPTAGQAGGPDEGQVGTAELPVIAGYKVLEELGRGGMGIVYKAIQLSTRRVVALKVISAGPFASESARRRFDREVELAARLQHASIVRVLESGRVAGQKYYAMDLVEGVRMDSYLATAQPDVRATLGILERICEAVEYAHEHGVIHRDLKPANVLIDGEGEPHVLDFGLAKAIDQPDAETAVTAGVSLPGQVLGTLFYLAPEQAAGTSDEIDARTDVYALGVMMFETLTGSLPFDTTGRPSEVMQRIVETPPSRPSLRSERVDSELETIILKALEKEKARRYQSAADLAEDLSRYLAGQPILAKRSSCFYTLRKKVLRHRLAVAIIAVVVALALIGLVAETRSRRKALANARRVALRIQNTVELGSASDGLGDAGALYSNWGQRLPEAILVYAYARYRDHPTPEGSIRLLEDEINKDPSDFACRALLADIYRTIGLTERSETLQARVEQDAPDTAEGWYLRSFATLDRQCALQCAEEAVKHGPLHAPAWSRLTYLRWQAKDLDRALQGADTLLELGELPYTWRLFKGHVLVVQGRFREAIDEYNQRTPIPLVNRAHAYRGLKEYDNAVADYDAAIEVEGKAPHVWTLYHRATPLWILGRTDEALSDYRRVRTLLGRVSYGDARRYLILREKNRERDAGDVLEAALREVEDPWLRLILRCLGGEITPDELVADATARDNREHLCEAYYYAGEVSLLSGDSAGARVWFGQCMQTDLAFDLDSAPAPMNEHELAQWRLETLFWAPPSPLPKKTEKKEEEA